MKAAFLTEFSEIGGGEKNLFHLAKELSKHIDAVLYCPKGKLFDQSVEAGLNVRELKGYNGKRWARFIPIPGFDLALRKELSGFDIVHAYSLNILPKLLFLKNAKIVWTAHGYWERPFGLRAKVINCIADKIIAVSNDVYNISRFPDNKKIKISLGIPEIKRGPAAKQDKKESDITIACVGRFQRIKGQDLLIKALIKLAEKYPDKSVKLYIVGDVNGSMREDLEYKKELIALKKSNIFNNLNIEFSGFQKDISGYLIKSDFAVVPSRYESFSMATVEALSYGLPVAAPNIGGIKDILTEETGIYFTPGNLDSLTEAVEKMFLLFNTFNKQTVINAARKFSIETQAAEHLRLYAGLING